MAKHFFLYQERGNSGLPNGASRTEEEVLVRATSLLNLNPKTNEQLVDVHAMNIICVHVMNDGI